MEIAAPMVNVNAIRWMSLNGMGPDSTSAQRDRRRRGDPEAGEPDVLPTGILRLPLVTDVRQDGHGAGRCILYTR